MTLSCSPPGRRHPAWIRRPVKTVQGRSGPPLATMGQIGLPIVGMSPATAGSKAGVADAALTRRLPVARLIATLCRDCSPVRRMARKNGMRAFVETGSWRAGPPGPLPLVRGEAGGQWTTASHPLYERPARLDRPAGEKEERPTSQAVQRFARSKGAPSALVRMKGGWTSSEVKR